MNDIVDEAWKKGVALGIQQKEYEWKSLLNLLLMYPHDFIMEIGDYSGGTAVGLSMLAKNLITLDLTPLEFDSGSCQHQHVTANSHLLTTQETVGGLIPTSLDILFIDGDHSYAGVKEDFLMYSSYVKPGGIVFFHDIVASEDHARQGCFVDQFWNEAKVGHTFTEIIGEPLTWGGIGVIWMP